MLIPVLLYGILAKKYGKRHMLAVSSPAEAVRALTANFPGFDKDLIDYRPGFHIFRGRENLGKEQLKHPSGKDAIRIVPAIQGAKKGGVLQIIIGVILIIVGAVIQVYGYGAPNPVSTALYQMGGAMILGGVVSLLTSTPKLGTTPDEAEANKPSYVFNGSVNTIAQGHNVPWGIGRVRTGSAVISGGIYVQQIDQAGTVTGTPDPTAPGDGGLPGEPGNGDGGQGGNSGGGVNQDYYYVNTIRVGEQITGPSTEF